MKAATVAVIGRPSSGKSSLVNAVCRGKVSIVSPTPQTTRNKIRGIVTEPAGQLVLLDTPGFYASTKKFNLLLQEVRQGALAEVDVVLYVIDVSRPPGEEERALVASVKPFKDKLLIAVNKTDLAAQDRSALETLLDQELAGVLRRDISALSGLGVPELVTLLLGMAPEGEALYPEEYYTDQEPAFRIAELVRERVILHTREELPHAVYIEIADMEMKDDNQRLWVRGFICVERESQKGIVIGKKGDLIRTIMTEARAAANELFPYRVDLDFRVRVRPRWRRDDRLLKKLIY